MNSMATRAEREVRTEKRCTQPSKEETPSTPTTSCPRTGGTPIRWQSHPATLAAMRRQAIETRYEVPVMVNGPTFPVNHLPLVESALFSPSSGCFVQEHVCNIHGIVTMLLVCTAYRIENFPSLVIRTKYEKKMWSNLCKIHKLPCKVQIF